METSLGISKDAVYRRLRGGTVWSTNELIELSRAYRVNIDERSTPTIPFFYSNCQYRL